MLKILRPRCSFCGRIRRLTPDVVAAGTYCGRCSASRQAKAIWVLDAVPVTKSDLTGRYLPRRKRA